MEALTRKNRSPAPFVCVLIALSKGGDGGAEALRELQGMFYDGIKNSFYSDCRKAVSKFYAGSADIEDIAKDIFQESIIVAIEGIGSFNVNEDWGDDECKKVIRYWLSKIANSKLVDRKRDEKLEQEVSESYLAHLVSENSEGEVAKRVYVPTFDRDKFDAMWSRLNPMSREILLLCAQHGTLKEENTLHLPDTALEEIRVKYSVTSAAIRKAKQRAIASLKACKINTE